VGSGSILERFANRLHGRVLEYIRSRTLRKSVVALLRCEQGTMAWGYSGLRRSDPYIRSSVPGRKFFRRFGLRVGQ
jgi:hypothetical protein